MNLFIAPMTFSIIFLEVLNFYLTPLYAASASGQPVRIIISRMWEERTGDGEVTVAPIPESVMQQARNKVHELTRRGRTGIIEQAVDGMYKVLTGPDAGEIRYLPSIIFGFKPEKGIDLERLQSLGSELATILQQESVCLEVDSTVLTAVDSATSTIVMIKLNPKIGNLSSVKRHALQSLTEAFGGATEVGLFEVSSIIHIEGGSSTSLQQAKEVVKSLSNQVPEIIDMSFRSVFASFPSGKRHLAHDQ